MSQKGMRLGRDTLDGHSALSNKLLLPSQSISQTQALSSSGHKLRRPNKVRTFVMDKSVRVASWAYYFFWKLRGLEEFNNPTVEVLFW
jgi:hypothetical protein